MNPPYNLLTSVLNTRIQLQESGLHLLIAKYFLPVVNTALHSFIYLITVCFVEWVEVWILVQFD